MHMNSRKLFLLVTACAEAAAGLCLLFIPAVLFALLLGVEDASPVAIFVGRLAGAALLAIGIACWIARSDTLNQAQFGLLAGVLFYNVAAAVLLVYAGTVLQMRGVLLWPTAALHTILAVWGISCLRSDAITGNPRGEAADRRTSQN